MSLTRRLLQQFRDHMCVEKLKYYERFRPHPISLEMYLSFGQEGTVEISFKFLQKELLVRLANITKVKLMFTFSSLINEVKYCFGCCEIAG